MIIVLAYLDNSLATKNICLFGLVVVPHGQVFQIKLNNVWINKSLMSLEVWEVKFGKGNLDSKSQ